MASVERLRGGFAPPLLYGLLALFSFPTFGAVIAGERGLGYVLDVFELPRTGILDTWPQYGLTLWNPYLTAGNALLAQQANPPFAIDVAVGLVAGPFAGYLVMGWLVAALAGFSMHLFLRDSLGLSTPAVVGGSVIFLFGFWIFINGASGVALPLMLWLGDRAMVRAAGRWRFILAGAVAGALLLYHGQSQIVLIAGGVQLAYLLLTSPAGGRRTRVGVWIATWALAIGMYGPVLLTQLVMLPISQRTIWDLRALYDPRPIEAIRDTLAHYSATLLGVPLGDGIGASPARYGTYFLGVIGLPLLVVGLAWGQRTARTRFLILLLVAIPLIDLVGVLLTPLQDQLGFLKSFQVVRVRQLFTFALTANAAVGLDVVVGWWTGERERPGRRDWRWVLLAAALVPLVIAGIVAAGQVLHRRRDLVGLETPALGWALLLLALLVGGAVVVAALAALWRARGDHGSSRGGAVAVLIVLLLLAGERAVYAHGERFVGPYMGDWTTNLGPTPGQAFILEQPGADLDRVLSFGEDANRMGAVGLLQADGNQAIYPVAYHDFFGALIRPQLDMDPAAATYFDEWGNRAITFGPNVDPELVALAGARWLYVRGDEVPTVPDAVPRFHDGDVTVYEVPSALPRAFLVSGVLAEPDPAGVFAALAAADLDTLRSTAYVAGPDASALGSPPTGEEAGAAGTATIVSMTPDRVDIDVHADGPAVLVLTDVMAPGWNAERDGVTAPIATVDGAFRGVAVDAGTSHVVFRYVPLFTYVGFAVALLALLAALSWAWLVRRSDGRRATASSTLSPAPPDAGGRTLEDR
jgi:hypothetical protein